MGRQSEQTEESGRRDVDQCELAQEEVACVGSPSYQAQDKRCVD